MRNSSQNKHPVVFHFQQDNVPALRKKWLSFLPTFPANNFGPNSGLRPNPKLASIFSNSIVCSIEVAAHRAREESNVHNHDPIQLVSIGHATHCQHKHGHQSKYSPTAPCSIHGPLASPAVVHIVGWRLSTCNFQPIHQNPSDQCSTSSIPQAGTPLSHDVLFIKPFKTQHWH